MDIGIFFSFLLLQYGNKYSSICLLVNECMSLLLGIHLETKLLGHRVYICSSLVDTAKQFSKVPTNIPTSTV